jgi:hypothetical protein
LHITLPISQSDHQTVEKKLSVKALIDSGAEQNLIDRNFVNENRLAIRKLEKPITPRNADGTQNIGGQITHCAYLDLEFDKVKLHIRFLVASLGKEDMFLGYQ